MATGGVSFRGNEHILKLTRVMVALSCKYTTNYWTLHSSGVNCMLCNYISMITFFLKGNSVWAMLDGQLWLWMKAKLISWNPLFWLF
jgi:hypothetical protein